MSDGAIAPPAEIRTRGRAHPYPARADNRCAARDARRREPRPAARSMPATRRSRSIPPSPASSSRWQRSSGDPDLCLVLGGDGTILKALRDLRRHAGARVRLQLRHDRVPGRGRSRRARRPGSPAPLRPTSRSCGCRASRPPSATRPRSRSTTSPSSGARTGASPSSPTASAARRSATCAATASSPRPRRGRPATTSRTRARSSPGA